MFLTLHMAETLQHIKNYGASIMDIPTQTLAALSYRKLITLSIVNNSVRVSLTDTGKRLLDWAEDMEKPDYISLGLQLKRIKRLARTTDGNDDFPDDFPALPA